MLGVEVSDLVSLKFTRKAISIDFEHVAAILQLDGFLNTLSNFVDLLGCVSITKLFYLVVGYGIIGAEHANEFRVLQQ